MRKQKVLFLCTGNSCRSQMAEGWLRHLMGDRYQAFSAGVTRHGLNRYAVWVMQEAGIDISRHYAKMLSELGGMEFDLVVTVCANAQESCPVLPGNARVVHAPFDDPPAMAAGLTDLNEIMQCYRHVRDQIGDYVKDIDQLMNGEVK